MSNILKNLESSILGLKGKTPEVRSAAKSDVTIHAPVKADNSKLDLDAKTPKKYLDELLGK